jgi:hypothetical protein
MRITPPIAVPWPDPRPTTVEVKAAQIKQSQALEYRYAQHHARIKAYEEYVYWRNLGRHIDVKV